MTNSATPRDVVRVVLVADPGLPADIVEELGATLPSRLRKKLSDRVDWQVRTLTAGVVVDEQVGVSEMVELVHDRLDAAIEGEIEWDVAVLLTDLPRREGNRPVSAEIGRTAHVALISLPALGSVRLTRRAARAIVTAIGLVLPDSTRPGPEDLPKDPVVGQPMAAGRGMPDRYVVPGLPGYGRLISGMVKANRPWLLFTSLSRALAGVFATAAYSLFNGTVWQVSDRLGWWRETVLAVLCLTALTSWIIIDHRLWERPDGYLPRARARLYNLVTAITIGLGVLCLYVTLFATLTAVTYLLLDTGILTQVLGHGTGAADSLDLSWVVASVALVGGAFGSGLEEHGVVRNAAYGRRQRERQREKDSENTD
ncbi:hypothetical protein ACIBBB_03515 [Streptomyces sp. NPDC051217]|uniref:hypothetical protein n=1 Tax=Streptomyces sp. NPDC051217 TaxID=3365644 RepID=UPI00379FB051